MLSEQYLNTDRALHADMFAALAERRAEILCESETALLLKERTGVRMLAAAAAGEAAEILSGLGDVTVVLHGDAAVEGARRTGWEIDPPCIQFFYAGAPLPVDGPLEIRHPAEEDFPAVEAHYGLYGGAHLKHDFDNPAFLGAYLDGNMVGFVGLHGEGSMGLLEIFPEYRRRGFAQELYSRLINNQLAAGKTPYCQVYADNVNSINLQRKLGFFESKQGVCWSWKE